MGARSERECAPFFYVDTPNCTPGVRSGNTQLARNWSALPPKADIEVPTLQYPLIVKSGHWASRQIALVKWPTPLNTLASGLVQDRTLHIHLIGLPDRHGRSNTLSASAVTVASDAVGFHVGPKRDVLKKAVELR